MYLLKNNQAQQFVKFVFEYITYKCAPFFKACKNSAFALIRSHQRGTGDRGGGGVGGGVRRWMLFQNKGHQNGGIV